MTRLRHFCLIAAVLWLLSACQEAPAPPVATPTRPALPTVTPEPTATLTRPQSAEAIDFVTVAIDVPSRNGLFSNFNEFGEVIGYDAEVFSAIAAETDWTVEFVVTRFEGMLESIATGEFDAAMAALVIPDTPEQGIVYTRPYLVTGQNLVVLANEQAIQSPVNVRPDMPIGYVAFTRSEQAARTRLSTSPSTLVPFDDSISALQALIDGTVRAVVIDSYDARAFSERYYQQLKIVGGSGPDAWLDQQAYGIAVAADNPVLLDVLNRAIAALQSEGRLEALAQERLVSALTLRAGESLIGTPADRVIIGVVGSVTSLEPAEPTRDFLVWELARNTMGGLFTLAADGTLAPLLADGVTVDESQQVYTFTLRDGLTFPDGTPFSAESVRASIVRASQKGNIEVNRYLKDSDLNGRIDDDAVQVVDARTVQITLSVPNAEFLALTATPPFFIVNPNCPEGTFDVTQCSGIGPYTVGEWEVGSAMRLEANPGWPGATPQFARVEVRFYPDAAAMRRSLENGSVDIAWGGLAWGDIVTLGQSAEYRTWRSDGVFRSHLVFEHSRPPWNDKRVRQAVAYAVDRDALAQAVFAGERLPLYSPIPTGWPEHAAVFPPRDLEVARDLLRDAGYSEASPAPVELWFVSDGRYSTVEERYAQALAVQLEETGLFAVTVTGAPWTGFIGPRVACELPVYLMAWPAPGGPQESTAALSWLSYFVSRTDTLCSNYDSAAMDELIDAVRVSSDPAERVALYGQIQALWADELPTLDLTEAVRQGVSLAKVTALHVDRLGLLHYDTIVKEP